MKKYILAIAFGSLLLVSLFGFTPIEFRQPSQQQLLRHVVLLDLNDQATDSVITMMYKDLQELKENITHIRTLEFGENIQQDADFSHCMFLIFESVEGLKVYEEHPLHLEFASTYGQYVAKKTEVDYWY